MKSFNQFLEEADESKKVSSVVGKLSKEGFWYGIDISEVEGKIEFNIKKSWKHGKIVDKDELSSYDLVVSGNGVETLFKLLKMKIQFKSEV